MTCNVCGKDINQSAGYVEGVDCYICGNCLTRLGKMWAKSVGIEFYDPEGDSNATKTADKKLMKPKEIKEYLDDYIIGQEEAKERISVAIYNHYKRIFKQNPEPDDEIEIEKSNIICIGPPGSGKTEIARTIAKMLDVPFAICDATSLTEAGYVGDDVESILHKLLQAADFNVEEAEKGIIFIDEIDKLARKGANTSITRDVSGEGVQQGLLKIIEGTVVGVPPSGGRKHPEQPLIDINTKNILFICGGAFDGIEKRIKERCNLQSVGFNATIERAETDEENILNKVSSVDIKSYGLIPELVGRLPVITHTNKLSKEDMKQILTKPKNAIVKQYQKLFDIDGIKLHFNDDALDAIVEHTMDKELGARGLRSVIEDVMFKSMYEAPSEENLESLTITKKIVDERLSA